MKFPVDVLVAVSHSELEQEAQSYMGELLYSNMECPEQLTLPDSTKVDISISSVGLVPLYGSCDTQKVLALFAPADPFTPVALYLLGQWWAVGDILHTADSSRDGLIQVDTLGERIVLYVLNRIVYRVQEMSSDELPFLCHGEQDFAKILWKNGQAVGFYSVKPTGSPCSSFSNRSYPLPVMDSLFVRKCHRGKGLGLRMLEDYVDSFKEDYLGLRYPLTTAMYKVCQCYLRAFPGDSELLWEVDSSRLNQRTSVASRIQNMSLTGVSRTLTYSESAVTVSVHHTEENMEEITIVKDTKGTGPAGQKNTDEQCSADIQISEEVTLLRLVQNTEVVQTEELLEVTTKNVMSIVVTELEEDTEIDQVTSLLRSQEDSEWKMWRQRSRSVFILRKNAQKKTAIKQLRQRAQSLCRES
ncbi:soluble lamin-associated protein of 75 kDa-like [Periophthalmus magnuspinnatus]|uniref:soluble lamin-associated protein of 75 kDa-like n=1 Tax=Periophthalmus magnuspinnatus TaxID=409849 RepID=UPI00145B0FC9|nr:soluble lamin-associated protein of 75 kDa-like [Periophthalmus magnuspinnatus]